MEIQDQIVSPMLTIEKHNHAVAEEHILKVRKPYTITKQRERWSEEEHKKFLEALQLHGRAWRRIEEHIGTKTAVQIRSHAQKFFSKVVRESADTTSPVEIPPPRPKRKPAHPYPRKLGNGGSLTIPKLKRSSSYEQQENGSPTSVLSGVGSDTLGSLLSETNFDPKEEKVPCLKLFGKTVMLPKPSSSPDRAEPVGQWGYTTPVSGFGDWWGMCGNLPQFSFVHQQNECSTHDKECSEGVHAVSSKRAKGFVPYKRCVVEKDHEVSDDGEGQSVALCL